jgi:hypothetical protein
VRLPKGFSVESVEVAVGEDIGDGWSWRAKAYVGIGDDFYEERMSRYKMGEYRLMQEK